MDEQMKVNKITMKYKDLYSKLKFKMTFPDMIMENYQCDTAFQTRA